MNNYEFSGLSHDEKLLISLIQVDILFPLSARILIFKPNSKNDIKLNNASNMSMKIFEFNNYINLWVKKAFGQIY